MILFSDLRQGWREFRSTPSVSAVAVVTLALGIAGATAMFAMISAITAAMVPPGVDARRVGRITWTNADDIGGGRGPLTLGEFAEVRTAVTQFEVVSASSDDAMVLGGDGPAVPVKRVSADFFRTFGFAVSAGRVFTTADERAGSDRVAIVGEAFLERCPAYGLGSRIRLGGDDFVVVGILPARCWFPMAGTDVWLPLPADPVGAPAARHVIVTGRLRSPGDLEAARSQVGTIGRRLGSDAAASRVRRLRLITLAEDAGKRVGFGIVGLLGPSIVVLLIACANVANLLLARGARREREMAVRAALGAGRMRLLRERLAESAWIAGFGGALGTLLAVLAVRALRAWVASFDESRRAAEAVRLDAGSLAFALAVTLAIPFVFGLVPAFVASRPNLLGALHQAPGRRKPRRGPYGGRDLLAVVEVGLAVVLVVMTAMFAQVLAELGRTEPGFEADRALTVGLSLDHDAGRRAVDARLLPDIVDAVARVEGVQVAAAGDPPDLPRFSGDLIEFEGCAGNVRTARTAAVGPGYFAALGLPILRGRAIDGRDTAGSPAAVVISEAQGARCWPGQDPLGRRVRLGKQWLTVVGVARDTMKTRLIPNGPQGLYTAYAQGDRQPEVLLIRSDRDASALTRDVRAAVRRIDPTQPLDRIERVGDGFRRRLSGTPLLPGILAGFSAFALALGALGVFSVMSYMVAERTREFGIRIALGASRREVVGLVMRQAFVVVAIGAAVSVTGTLAVTRVAFREMAELAATDPVLWAAVASVLAIVAIGASLVPARRAMRVEPTVALRAE